IQIAQNVNIQWQTHHGDHDFVPFVLAQLSSFQSAVPPPYTGNFMPPKPDLVFADEHVISESVNSLPGVAKSEIKTSETTLKNISALIIEDWVSNSEDENNIKTEKSDKQEENNRQTKYPRKNSQSPREKVNPVKGKVTTVRAKAVVSVVQGNVENAIKSSDQGIFDNGCSRHMTGNKSFLTDYQEFDGGFVAFRGSPKVGKSYGKDHLGKFEGKLDEGFLVGYFVNIKTFRGKGLEWLFDIDSLTISMNYEPVTRGNQTNHDAGTQSSDDKDVDEVPCKGDEGVSKGSGIDDQERTNHSTQDVNTVGPSINTANTNINTDSLNINTVGSNDPSMPTLEETGIFDDVYDDREMGTEADTNNLELLTVVSPIPTTRVHKDHPKEQIIRDLNLATQTKRMINFLKKMLWLATTTSREEQIIEIIITAYLLVFSLNKNPKRNKKDERGIVVRNKERLVVQCYTQEEGIDYDKKDDGIFICQDKYVVDILKKFGFSSVKIASTPMEPNKALIKDVEAEDVPSYTKDFTFHVVKRIFRYLKGQPKLGLWYPRDSLFDLEAFSDSDYAGASLDRKSTTRDGKKIIITEASNIRDLRLDDAEGTTCLPNAVIFEELARVGWSEILYVSKIFPSVCDHQLGDMSHHKRVFVNPSLTKKVFANMKRVETSFSGRKHKSRKKQRKETTVPHIKPQNEKHIPTPSYDPLPIAKIKKLKKRVKKLEGKKKKRTHGLKRLYKGRIAEIDADKDLSLINETVQDQGRINDEDLFGVNDVDGDEVIVDVTAEEERTAREKNEANRVAIKEWDDVHATIDADRQLAKQLQAQEREQLSIEERSKLLAKLIKSRKNFVAMDSEVMEGSKKTQSEVTECSSKRAGDEIEQESAKRQRLEKEDDTSELKRCLEIVPEDDDDVTIEATPISSKSPIIVDYNIYKEDNIWKYQQGVVKVHNWKLYDSCGVYCVTTQNMVYYLLVKKRYTFTNNILHQLWKDVRLQVDYEVEMAYDLFRLIKK
nr:hypothetical protein [Tanacetum cinerariifolium]